MAPAVDSKLSSANCPGHLKPEIWGIARQGTSAQAQLKHVTQVLAAFLRNRLPGFVYRQ